MVAPFLLKKETGEHKFFWNLDENVGVASPNRPDDVHLVQFGYFIMSTSEFTQPDLKPTSANVKLGVPCTGREDDPLVQAIRADQKSRRGPQDDHVSKLRSDAPGFAPGRSFMLVAIMNNIFDATANDYPRIDLHLQCPPIVKTAVQNGCRLSALSPS